MMGSMAGKKGSTQFAVSRRKMIAPPAPWLPSICAAFAGLEPQLSNHKTGRPAGWCGL
jgi:hypothetical protein